MLSPGLVGLGFLSMNLYLLHFPGKGSGTSQQMYMLESIKHNCSKRRPWNRNC